MGLTAVAFSLSGLTGQSAQGSLARTCFLSESLIGVGACCVCCAWALGFLQAAAAEDLLFSLSWHSTASSDRCLGLHQTESDDANFLPHSALTLFHGWNQKLTIVSIIAPEICFLCSCFLCSRSGGHVNKSRKMQQCGFFTEAMAGRLNPYKDNVAIC